MANKHLAKSVPMTSVRSMPMTTITELYNASSRIRPQTNKLESQIIEIDSSYSVPTIPGVLHEQMRLILILRRLQMQHA